MGAVSTNGSNFSEDSIIFLDHTGGMNLREHLANLSVFFFDRTKFSGIFKGAMNTIPPKSASRVLANL